LQTTDFALGLFGYDLTDFFADCLTATDCNSDDYNADYFDGWAAGSNITIESAFVSDYLIVVLEDYLTSFGFETDGSGLLTTLYSMPVPPGYTVDATTGDAAFFDYFEGYGNGYGF